MKTLLIIALMSIFMLSACVASTTKVPTRTSTTKYVVDPDCQ